MPKQINLKGVIVSNDEKWIYDWFGLDNVSPNDVSAGLDEAAGEDVEVVINSGGGSVFAGSEIYTALKSYAGNTTAKIVGIAGSAASVAAMGTNRTVMSPTAQLMIHNTAGRAAGDYRAMQHTADVLKNANAAIANAYRLKTGMTEAEVLNMMNAETWMTAQTALEKKFIDEIMFDEQLQLVNNAPSFSGMLPADVINKARTLLAQQTEPPKGENEDMDLDELKAKHPELYNQIVAAAVNDAAAAERQRLQAIDEIANAIDPALVAKAKYTEPMTAEKLALEALKTDVAKGATYTAARAQELEVTNTAVKTAQPPVKDDAAIKAAKSDALAEQMNKMRGAESNV